MGKTEEAMTFYKSVLGGEFTIFQRYKEVPGGEKMSKEDQEKIVHVSLDFGNGQIIMATDMVESMEQKLVEGDNFHICVHLKSEQEADRIFKGLSAGGKVDMPMNKTFWGAYFGMLKDKFGIPWMISYNYSQQ
jgi:PhnB protein